jgi:hypothetical protein
VCGGVGGGGGRLNASCLLCRAPRAHVSAGGLWPVFERTGYTIHKQERKFVRSRASYYLQEVLSHDARTPGTARRGEVARSGTRMQSPLHGRL